MTSKTQDVVADDVVVQPLDVEDLEWYEMPVPPVQFDPRDQPAWVDLDGQECFFPVLPFWDCERPGVMLGHRIQSPGLYIDMEGMTEPVRQAEENQPTRLQQRARELAREMTEGRWTTLSPGAKLIDGQHVSEAVNRGMGRPPVPVDLDAVQADFEQGLPPVIQAMVQMVRDNVEQARAEREERAAVVTAQQQPRPIRASEWAEALQLVDPEDVKAFRENRPRRERISPAEAMAREEDARFVRYVDDLLGKWWGEAAIVALDSEESGQCVAPRPDALIPLHPSYLNHRYTIDLLPSPPPPLLFDLLLLP